MKDRKQLNTWDKEGKCKKLQERWGDYDDFPSKKNKLVVIDTLTGLIKNELNGRGAVLEVGCGAGHFLWKLKDLGSSLIGLDYSPHMLKITREQFKKIGMDIKTVEGSCWDLPFPDNYTDLSYQIDVCMHVGGGWKSIQEMIRVSKSFVLFTGPSFENFTDVMDKQFARQSWAISYPLLLEELEKLSDNNKIDSFEFINREATKNYKHKLLVIRI